MKTMTAIAPLVLSGLLGCQPGSAGAAAEVAASAGEAPAAEARVVDRLPLQPGYYVSTDTPCAKASNASLHVMREDGSGYGGYTTPPYFCRFVRIEQTGPSSYRVTETCESAYGDDEEAPVSVSSYEISSQTSYRAKNGDGWESSSRRCPRRELPALWRESDIGDFVD